MIVFGVWSLLSDFVLLMPPRACGVECLIAQKNDGPDMTGIGRFPSQVAWLSHLVIV